MRTKFKFILMLLLFLLTSVTYSSSEYDWQQVRDEDGIQVYLKNSGQMILNHFEVSFTSLPLWLMSLQSLSISKPVPTGYIGVKTRFTTEKIFFRVLSLSSAQSAFSSHKPRVYLPFKNHSGC